MKLAGFLLIYFIAINVAYGGSGRACEKYLKGDPAWKLIRDRLPEIFKEEGSDYVVDRVTDVDVLKSLLLQKLSEELKEFKEDPSMEEMADLMEVIEELQRLHGFSAEALAEVKSRKLKAKGGFRDGFVMKVKSPIVDPNDESPKLENQK